MVHRKKIKGKSDLDAALVSIHDFMKMRVALHMVDLCYGCDIFPHTPQGQNYTAVIAHALDAFLNMNSEEESSTLLNRRVRIGQSTFYVSAYLDTASGRLHDAILNKFCDAFFAGLPEENLLSATALISQTRRTNLARRVDEVKEYYRTSHYDMVWKNACHTALSEIICAGLTAARNIKRYFPDV